MKILHITDLHIGWEERIENEKQIWDRLFREISETVNENKIDMLGMQMIEISSHPILKNSIPFPTLAEKILSLIFLLDKSYFSLYICIKNLIQIYKEVLNALAI